MNRCETCKHYTPTDMPEVHKYVYAGACALMGDSNEMIPRVAIDRASGWDYEGYAAGVYVGPQFGCIHWADKAAEQQKGD